MIEWRWSVKIIIIIVYHRVTPRTCAQVHLHDTSLHPLFSQQPLESLLRILSVLLSNLQIRKHPPKRMWHSRVNVPFGRHPVILEYLLHNQAAVPDGIESAYLEIRLGNALVGRECQWEGLWAKWIRLI